MFLPLLALAAFGLFRVLRRVSERCWPVPERSVFWGTVLTIVLASRFLIRDILECGVNLALVALAWGAVWCWRQRRDVTGGGLLGFAIALKLTPALFLAWFVWKRQWKIAFATLLTATLLFLSPLLFIDRAKFVDVHRVWWHHASRGLLAENPVQGVLGEESIQNVALRPASAGIWCICPKATKPASIIPGPAVFGSFPARGGMGGPVADCGASAFSGLAISPAGRSRTEPAFLWEAAAVSVMILLLSPLTWGQHCVGVIPAAYFLIREAFHRRSYLRSSLVVLGIYSVFILLLNRGLIGKQATYLLDSYYTTTWCLAAVLWLVLRSHRQEIATQQEAVTLPLRTPHGHTRREAA